MVSGKKTHGPQAVDLAAYHSPLTTHHSPLTTHHSPLTTHHSLFHRQIKCKYRPALRGVVAAESAAVGLDQAFGNAQAQAQARLLAGYERLKKPAFDELVQIAQRIKSRLNRSYPARTSLTFANAWSRPTAAAPRRAPEGGALFAFIMEW